MDREALLERKRQIEALVRGMRTTDPEFKRLDQEWHEIARQLPEPGLAADMGGLRDRMRQDITSGNYGTERGDGIPMSTKESNGLRERMKRLVNYEFDNGWLGERAAEHLGEITHPDNPTSDIASRYLLAVGDRNYLTAFTKIAKDPQMGNLKWTPAEREAVDQVNQVEAERAMSVGTNQSGGFAVPFVLDPTVMASGSGALNPIRRASRVVTIAGATQWKGISSDGVTASYVPEATEATDGSPTLAQPTVTTTQYRVFVPYSLELEGDWPELGRELLKMAVDARDVLDATKWLSGSGTAEPAGFFGANGLGTAQRVQTAGTAACASLMIAAGVGFKQLSEYMGHSSIIVTIDRYGHLLPGARSADAARLDALLSHGTG